MPNADAGGYFRFALSNHDLDQLRRHGWSHLNVREQLALADSLSAAFAAGAIDTAALLGAASMLARSSERSVCTAPMGWLSFARDYLVDATMRSKVEAVGRSLYVAHGKRLGWTEQPAEDGDTRLLRADVLGFLALEVNDPATRREALKRGRAYVGFGTDGVLHAEAIATDLVGVALTVAVQEGDAAYFEHLVTLLGSTNDAVLRERLLSALGATRDSVLAERALSFALDPAVRVNEALSPLSRQLGDPDQRDGAWAWLVGHIDAVLTRVGPARGGRMPWLGASYCSREASEQVRSLFTKRIDALHGGPRNLQGALEAIALCVAKVEAQHASALEFFLTRSR
jgi:alanyl aminopeptidase